MTPAQAYLKSLFQTEEDYAAFLWAHKLHPAKQVFGQRRGGHRGIVTGEEVSDDYEDYGVIIKSYESFPGSGLLVPAIIQQHFYNPKHRSDKHPYFFWLHFYKHGFEICDAVKIERDANGVFPKVLREA